MIRKLRISQVIFLTKLLLWQLVHKSRAWKEVGQSIFRNSLFQPSTDKIRGEVFRRILPPSFTEQECHSMRWLISKIYIQARDLYTLVVPVLLHLFGGSWGLILRPPWCLLRQPGGNLWQWICLFCLLNHRGRFCLILGLKINVYSCMGK